MRLKLRLADSTEVVSLSNKPDNELTVQDLIDQLRFPDLREIRAGYPPKPLAFDTVEARSMGLISAGIRNGDQLVVNVGTNERTGSVTTGISTTQPPPKNPVLSSQPSQSDMQSVPCGDGYLCLRVMEDDNSCLFRAVGYAFMRNLDSMVELRTLVATAIRNNPIDYNDAILGKKSAEYIRWILKESSWGGAIELDILAKHFDVTIFSLDVSTQRVDHFNPGKQQFIIVVYSGIHYDAVALSPLPDAGVSDFDSTVFTADESGAGILQGLGELGKKLKSRHYYTDTASFELKCKICGVIVKGEAGATKHAELTMHVDFGEV
jgi:ubiquitin thioesterase OTU1